MKYGDRGHESIGRSALMPVVSVEGLAALQDGDHSVLEEKIKLIGVGHYITQGEQLHFHLRWGRNGTGLVANSPPGPEIFEYAPSPKTTELVFRAAHNPTTEEEMAGYYEEKNRRLNVGEVVWMVEDFYDIRGRRYDLFKDDRVAAYLEEEYGRGCDIFIPTTVVREGKARILNLRLNEHPLSLGKAADILEVLTGLHPL